jgi:hypothetical protein
MQPHLLLERLDAIGRSVAASGQALALIGLGSAGLERDRLDEHSDLDFFVVARAGRKSWFLDDLGWLSACAPIAYQFRNTADGCKLLFADGIFCEFAIFERAELAAIPFAAGRVVWRDPSVDEGIARPTVLAPAGEPPAAEWLLGEALTNLYVGLGRAARGEKLSAARFIQGYAVDRVIELIERLEPAQAAGDPFSRERRFEQRFPGLAGELGALMQGYERSRESALAILAFLEARFPVSPAMAAAIRALA